MLQVANATPLTTALMLAPDPAGVDTCWATIKGTFTLSPTPRLADVQRPVAIEPVHAGDPATSSMLVPIEVGLAKPGTDVLLHGHAVAPDGRPVPRMDVALEVGPVVQHARVHGDRWWFRQPGGWALSEPAPFERTPLLWERTWGGRSDIGTGERHDPRNPIGCGYRHADAMDAPETLPAPNVEDANDPATTPGTRGTPVGFLPIGAHWQPRPRYAGTYDDAWITRRAPYLPADFDARFLQVAPPALIASTPLTGGEPIRAWGVTADGYVESQVPSLTLSVTWRVAGRTESTDVAIDSVCLWPDDGVFTVCWRTALRCDKSALKIRALHVDARGLA
ncbi:MAG: DUF2169 domain-containing protein [Gemmatimonadaceae bacterium]|nr:DUF2169 domain-containing protein [Gemmatimonadaceae bacterium]